MTSSSKHISEEVLLTEYKEAMASQRSNTNIIYSWTGSIFLVLSTGLFIYGLNASDRYTFFSAMAMAVLLISVWWGMTETFVFYIVQRIRRISEIEEILGMQLMTGAGAEIRSMKWRSRFVEARFYVRTFSVLYIVIWAAIGYVRFYLD